MDKPNLLTYSVLFLIVAGGLFAAYEPRFTALYNTFVMGILTAKGAGHIASLGSQYMDNRWGDSADTTAIAPIQQTVINEAAPIVPSVPVPKKPLGPVSG
jgi:hypothetical protein